jgi:hypothetical protein
MIEMMTNTCAHCGVNFETTALDNAGVCGDCMKGSAEAALARQVELTEKIESGEYMIGVLATCDILRADLAECLAMLRRVYVHSPFAYHEIAALLRRMEGRDGT